MNPTGRAAKKEINTEIPIAWFANCKGTGKVVKIVFEATSCHLIWPIYSHQGGRKVVPNYTPAPMVAVIQAVTAMTAPICRTVGGFCGIILDQSFCKDERLASWLNDTQTNEGNVSHGRAYQYRRIPT